MFREGIWTITSRSYKIDFDSAPLKRQATQMIVYQLAMGNKIITSKLKKKNEVNFENPKCLDYSEIRPKSSDEGAFNLCK